MIHEKNPDAKNLVTLSLESNSSYCPNLQKATSNLIEQLHIFLLLYAAEKNTM
jgi:hypothetical protein